MGELILCKQSIAAIPYYIERGAVNIYSLEELSYYVYHNVYQIRHDFMSLELCHWIGAELKIPALEEQLMEMLKENVPLHIFVGHILSYCGYLTQGEIRETLVTISTFENKSEAERGKVEADRLMEEGRYVQAIRAYEAVLNEDNIRNQSMQFMGDIWHDMGVAYGRLFCFEEAARCFSMAYERNRKDSTLKALIAAVCGDEEQALKDVMQKFHIPPTFVQQVQQEMQAISETKSIRNFAQSLDMYGLQTSFYQKEDIRPEEILQDWKTEYRNM